MNNRISNGAYIPVLFFLWVLACANADTSSSFIKSSFKTDIDKKEYRAGETIYATVNIWNEDEYVISEGYLVLELMRGQDSPSSPAMQDSIIAYKVINGINVQQNKNSLYKAKIKIPEFASSGMYVLNFYLKTPYGELRGIPQIFLPGAYIPLKITEEKDVKRVEIIKNGTQIEGEAGQVGPTINKTKAQLKVSVKNFYKNEEKIVLRARIASWDDTVPNSLLEAGQSSLELPWKQPAITAYEKEGTINPHEQQEFSFDLVVPKIPTAYSILIEALDGDGELLSLYRSRMVVPGSNSRIILLASNSSELVLGREGKIKFACVSPADGSGAFKGKAQILVNAIMGKTQELVHEETIPIEFNENNSDDVIIKEFQFKSNATSPQYKVEAFILDGNDKAISYAKTYVSRDSFNGSLPSWIDFEILGGKSIASDYREGAAVYNPNENSEAGRILNLIKDDLGVAELVLEIKGQGGEARSCEGAVVLKGADSRIIQSGFFENDEIVLINMTELGLGYGNYSIQFTCAKQYFERKFEYKQVSEQDLCADVSCPDKCTDSISFYRGVCREGQCLYVKKGCLMGCNGTKCVDVPVSEEAPDYSVMFAAVIIVLLILLVIVVVKDYIYKTIFK